MMIAIGAGIRSVLHGDQTGLAVAFMLCVLHCHDEMTSALLDSISSPKN